jgi:hypothetical protein
LHGQWFFHGQGRIQEGIVGDYMTEISEAVGLPHYPRQGPFGRKEGALIGARDGYLVAIGPHQGSRNRLGIGMLLRYGNVTQPEAVKAAAKDNSSKPSGVKVLEAGSDSLTLTWPYSFRKPKAPEVASLLKSTLDAIKSVAPTLDGHCEKCHSSATQPITLRNGAPGYTCYDCQHRLRQELDAAALAYEDQPSDFPKGLAYGVAAALIGSLAWGGVAYFLHMIFLYGSILIGYFVATAVARGSGKIDRAGQVVVPLLTIASVLGGDVLYFTLEVAKNAGVHLSAGLLFAVLSNFEKLETGKGGIASLFFALIGAGIALYRMRKPKFTVQFESLTPRAT